MLHSWNLNATDGNPVRTSTGRLVARSEEQNRDTVPTSRFAWWPSTMNSLFPAERVYPQNYMADRQKLQISKLPFDKFPTHSTFSCSKKRFKTRMSACSSFPSEAMWIKEAEMVYLVEELIFIEISYKRKVSLEEQKAQKEDRCVRGRQIAFMVQDSFRATGTHETVLDHADLFSINIRTVLCRSSSQDGTIFTIFDKDSTRPYSGESVEIEETSRPHWNCITWKFTRKNHAQESEIENDGEDMYSAETSTAKFLTLDMKKSKDVQSSRVTGD